MTKEPLDRYDRGARMLADLQYVPFPDVAKVIPEFNANVRRVGFRKDSK